MMKFESDPISYLQIYRSDGTLSVTVYSDGSVELGDHVRVNEAAMEFWSQIGWRVPGAMSTAEHEHEMAELAHTLDESAYLRECA